MYFYTVNINRNKISNMINIDGIQVDITTSIDGLSNEWAVFIVEFEFDNRLIVCHTFNQSVYRGTKNLISQILSVNAKSIELRQALLNSKYITVNIEKYGLADESEVLARKYELIKANRTYLPYGYNTLIKAGNAFEQNYANILLQELMNEVDKNAMYPHNSIYNMRRRGRLSKSVCSYDRNTGLFINEYASIKDAAEETGICASNISMCCNGHIKSAGGYIWSYIYQPIIDISQSKDRRFREAQIPSEAELIERQKEFITKNQN